MGVGKVHEHMESMNGMLASSHEMSELVRQGHSMSDITFALLAVSMADIDGAYTLLDDQGHQGAAAVVHDLITLRS